MCQAPRARVLCIGKEKQLELDLLLFYVKIILRQNYSTNHLSPSSVSLRDVYLTNLLYSITDKIKPTLRVMLFERV